MTRWHVLAYSTAAFIFVVVLAAPTPEGLTPEGQRCLAIFTMALVFWVTNVIPMSVTSLFAIVLLPLLGVLSSKQAFALFGNPAVFFILGALILSAGLLQSGLSARLAEAILDEYRERGESRLDAVREAARQRGIDCQVLLREGEFAEECLRVMVEKVCRKWS